MFKKENAVPQSAEPVDDPSAAPLSGKGPFKTADALIRSMDAEPVKSELSGWEGSVSLGRDQAGASDTRIILAPSGGRQAGSQPIKLSKKCTLWRGAEVLAWLDRPDTYTAPE